MKNGKLAQNKKATEAFLKYLKFTTSPVALKMCTSRDKLPPKTRIPSKAWGLDFRACQAVQVARRYEVPVAVPRSEMPCPTGSVALGFYKPNALYWSGVCLSPPYMSQKAKKVRGKNTPKLEAGKYEYMLVSPLDQTSYAPDVVLFYGNPGQITKLVQAAILKTGEPLTAKTTCGTACGEWASAAILTRKCQFVFPCDGERRFGVIEDSEMVFSMPYEKMDEILEALKIAYHSPEHRKYPVERFLIHQGPNSERYARLIASLRKDAGLA